MKLGTQLGYLNAGFCVNVVDKTVCVHCNIVLEKTGPIGEPGH